MKTLAGTSSTCAVLVAVALGAAGCKKDDPQPMPGDEAKEADDDGGEAKAGDDGEPASPKDKEGGLAQKALDIVAGPRNIEPKYPAQLDPLLDLVPADAETFIVVRDVGALVEGTLGYYEAQKATFEGMRDEVGKDDPGDAAEMSDVLERVGELRQSITDAGIDTSAGMIFAVRGDEKLSVVYGAAKADAFPSLLGALGKKGEMPSDCQTIASAAGYQVCTTPGAKAYAAGSKAADLRRKVAAELPGVDLERANVVAHVESDGTTVPFAIETGQGMAHVALALPQARATMTQYLQAGTPTGLGLIAPGEPFVWAQGSKTEIGKLSSTSPAMARATIDALTGEIVMGGLKDTKGYVVLAGVDDPAPAAGLVGIGGLAMGEIPKSLPDGTKVDAKAETVDGVSTLHLAFSGGRQDKIVRDLGYSSELFAFAVAGYGGFSAGATKDVVKVLEGYKGTGPTPDMLAALPTPLADALGSSGTAAAMYMPFDALQSQASRDTLEAMVDLVPPSGFGASDPATVFELGLDMMAPLSSTSFWISDLTDGPVVHVVVQGFAEAGTPEGADALAAIESVTGGADRATTYAALATKYPSSKRVSSYKARAGQLGDPVGSMFAMSAVGMAVGLLFFAVERGSSVAVAVPAAPVPPVPPPPPPPPTE